MPFGGYEDFDAGVAANRDAADPDAYCGKIRHEVEGKSSEGHSFDELPEDARKTWMGAFKEASATNDGPTSGRAAWAGVYRRWFKGADGKWAPLKAFEDVMFKSLFKSERVVYGVASLEMKDKDGQVITADALRSAFRAYLDRGHVMFYHKNIPIGEVLPSWTGTDGKVYESGVKDKALDVVVRFYKDTKIANDVWAEVEKGTLRAFSIGGEVIGDTVTVHDAGGSYERIDRMDLHEISVVPEPAYSGSYFSII